MKILLDSTFPGGYAAGLEVWTQNLIHSLAAIDNINQYVIFGFFIRNFSHRKKTIHIPQQTNFSLYVKKLPRPFVVFLEDHNISVIEKLLLRQNIDIYHGTGYFLPCLKKIKGIVTIHGLDFAEMDTYWYKDKWYKNVPLYLKRSDAIVTVSKYVKNSIVNNYKIPQEKIIVVYPGISEQFRIMENTTNEINEKLNVYSPYVLTVATSVERKNLKRLLNAFSIVANKIKELKLIIVGNKENFQKGLGEEIEKFNLEGKVIFPGYLNPEKLVYFYNRAEVFVFPSLYEGFGLPVLEAMTCGCPVIASNVSALPEITGGAAILINPYSPEEIACAIERVLLDRTTRNKMREAGLKEAKKFSWKKTAEEMIGVYRTVLSE